MLREAFPRLAAILRRAELAANAWRGSDHDLAIHYRAGEPEYVDPPGGGALDWLHR
jgi:hypothetical protein